MKECGLIIQRTMWYDKFQAFKLTPIGKKWSGESHIYSVWRELKVWQKNQTFMSGPSTWSLKTCHIPTVGMLRWKFLCFVYIFVCVFMWQALHGSSLLISLCKKNFNHFTLFVSVYWSHSDNVTLLISLSW